MKPRTLLVCGAAVLGLSACKPKVDPGQDLKDEFLKISRLQTEIHGLRGRYSYSASELGYMPPANLPLDFFFKANETQFRVTACIQENRQWALGKASVPSGCVSVADNWDTTWAKADIDSKSLSEALGVKPEKSADDGSSASSSYEPSSSSRFSLFRSSRMSDLLDLLGLTKFIPFLLAAIVVGFFLLRRKGVGAGLVFGGDGRGFVAEPHFKLTDLSFEEQLLTLKGSPFWGPIPSAGTTRIEITSSLVKVDRDQPTFNGGYHHSQTMSLGQSVQHSVYQQPADLKLRVLACALGLAAIWLFTHDSFVLSVVLVLAAAIALWYAQLKAGIVLKFLGKDGEFHFHFQSSRKEVFAELRAHLASLYPRLEGK